MSHFAVLVVGANPDEQLAPYHEFECTGHIDKYVQNIDITDEVIAKMKKYAEEPREKREPTPLARALEWFGIDGKRIESEDEAELEHKHKYGYAVVTDNILVKAVKRTNPNKKWDWWVIGGRWTGFFKLRPGFSGTLGQQGTLAMLYKEPHPAEDRADQCIKGSLDIEGMRAEKAEQWGQRWEEFHAVWDKFPGSKTWEQLVDIEDVEKRRNAYHAQPVVAAMHKARLDPFDNYTEYLVPKDVFVQRGRDSALSSFALVKDGVWYEQGEMGWFGVVFDEKDQAQWNREFTALFESLPDDTLLTIVDCHI